MATAGPQRKSAQGKNGKKEMDPETLLKMKFRAKCRFRAIGRLALANAYWLYEESEQYIGVEDVKKRVAQAMRAKKKQLLSLADKALLNKPAKERTDQEKSYIYRIIGGLKCFKRYPNNVKKKLAAVTYFKYYGPNRVIVRQNHDAVAMYFIITGDVVISHMVYDDLLNKDVSVELGVMHSGDMFGEVSLLHNIPRTATCTTLTHCELLALMKEDFKNVLQATIQASWDEVRRAMSFFTYFDALDEVARREGCIMAKMRLYSRNQVILGDGQGIPNFAYFVLSGQCQMIERLQVICEERLGRTYYSLYDPHESKTEEDDEFNQYFKNIDGSQAIGKQSETVSASSLAATDKTTTMKSFGAGSKEGKRASINAPSAERYSKRNVDPEVKAVSSKEDEQEVTTDDQAKSAAHLETLLPPTDRVHRESVRYSVIKLAFEEPANLRTYFMQYNPGATFGIGENMRDRRIVALTPVECMLMPKVWLLQRNTANIWSRIEHFLEKRIPSKKQLFKAFVAERRWFEYCDGLVEDIVDRSHTVNWTTLHDVPYSIRMEEIKFHLFEEDEDLPWKILSAYFTRSQINMFLSSVEMDQCYFGYVGSPICAIEIISMTRSLGRAMGGVLWRTTLGKPILRFMFVPRWYHVQAPPELRHLNSVIIRLMVAVVGNKTEFGKDDNMEEIKRLFQRIT